MESIITVSTPIQTFPNGNLDILKPDILGYVDRYQSFLRKTAESILGLADTVQQAEVELNSDDFLSFCGSVGLVKGSSTYSKLKKIAENVERFRPFIGRLPNTWTTIYKLSKLEPDQFARVSSSLNPFMTSKEIDAEIGSQRKVNMAQTFEFKVALGGLNEDTKAEVYDALIELRDRFHFYLFEDRKVVEEMKTITLAQAA